MARGAVTDPREYRRGVILGLTFAEVLLLLLFLLLLAAAALVDRRSRTTERLEALGRALEEVGLPADAGIVRRLASDRIGLERELQRLHERLREREAALARGDTERAALAARLARSELALRAAKAELSEAQKQVEELRRDYQRSRAEATELAAALALLKEQAAAREDRAGDVLVQRLAQRNAELEATLERTARERDEARARLDGLQRTVAERFAKLVEHGRDLEQRLGEAERERDELRAQLASVERDRDRELARRMIAGGVYPSCWEENGRPVFVFEVVLRTGGKIVVSDTAPAQFKKGEPWASIGPFERNRLIDVHAFVAATRPLTEWSKRQDPECRFRIRVRRELPLSAPTSEYLRVVGPLGSAATQHLPFYRVGG